MDKVYQVFVSSTFSDLENERKAVSDTLAKSGFIPSGMELFPATDQQQLEFIKRIIDRCDYYVVIVAARYGSLDGDKSYTEKEYEYAVSKRIPVLAFIHKDPGKIVSEKTDRDPEQVKRLDSFRSRLKASRIVSFWTSADDLRTEVLTAVTNAVNLSPGVGWVRGDQAIDPRVVQELEKIRIENDELKKRLAIFEAGEINFPPDLLGPTENFSFIVVGRASGRNTQKIPAQMRIDYLFAGIADNIISEASEAAIGQRIVEQYLGTADAKEHDRSLSYGIEPQDLVQLRFHLEALGLIQSVGRYKDSNFANMQYRDEYIAWSITEKGRKFIANLWAIRRK
jgi:hypothetical protein